MQAVQGSKDLFTWKGRTLRLIGSRKVPKVLKDNESGEVLWALEGNTKFSRLSTFGLSGHFAGNFDAPFVLSGTALVVVIHRMIGPLAGPRIADHSCGTELKARATQLVLTRRARDAQVLTWRARDAGFRGLARTFRSRSPIPAQARSRSGVSTLLHAQAQN
eukprot:3434957-Rhodomonas_salina.5